MINRKPFEKARPEEVGVPSKLILEYIDNLDIESFKSQLFDD